MWTEKWKTATLKQATVCIRYYFLRLYPVSFLALPSRPDGHSSEHHEYDVQLECPTMSTSRLVNLERAINLGKPVKVALKQLDVVPHVRRAAGLADRVHRKLREANVDGSDVG